MTKKKYEKRLLVLVAVLALIVAMGVPALGATTANTHTGTAKVDANPTATVSYVNTATSEAVGAPLTGDGSIVITLPTGKGADGRDFEYHIYRIFDATGTTGTGVSYKLVNGALVNGTDPSTVTESTQITDTFVGKHTTDTANPTSDNTVEHTYAFFYENGSIVLKYATSSTSGETQWTTAGDDETINIDDAAYNESLKAAIDAYITEVNSHGTTPIPDLVDVTVTDHTLNSTTGDYTQECTLTIDSLPYGYYYITTTAGTMVTINTAATTATVNDKDTVYPPPKEITGISNGDSSEDRYAYSVSTTTVSDGSTLTTLTTIGTAQIGDTIDYSGTVTVGQGAINYYYRDKMSDGLTLDTSSIAVKHVTSTGSTTEPTSGTEGTDYIKLAGKWYTIEDVPATTTDGTTVTTNWTATTVATDSYTFQVAFDNDFISNYSVGTKFVVLYSATLNSNANMGSTGNVNEAWLAYGNTPTDGSQPETPHETTTVYTGKITITKKDGSNNGLGGAEFILRNDSKVNSAGEMVYTGTEYTNGTATAENGKYYKWTEQTDGTYKVTWVDDQADATLFASKSDGTVVGILDDQDKISRNDDGTINWDDTTYWYDATNNPDGVQTIDSFQGLPVGKFTVIETRTPDGYNTAAPEPFDIKKVDASTTASTGESDGNTNVWTKTIDLSGDIVNKQGSTFPSTGGIGTTILYVVGSILVIGACVLLITRKRMKTEK
jgi:LPXTG-motif cell wall-anchored protein